MQIQYQTKQLQSEMKVWSSQLWLRFKQSQLGKPEKCYRGFNGIQIHGFCISAAVLYQLSYEDPYVGSKPICWIHHTRERNETYEYYEMFHLYVRSSHNIHL